ncbi:hypothetical protein IFR05_017327, partial [Cadophora sp. M221]
SNAFEELKQGLRLQQKRKVEWTGGTISGEIKVLETGEALRMKNEKVAQKREERATRRAKALETRQNVLVRRKHELKVKIKKRGKAVGDEAIAKAIKEMETAQENLDKAEKQQVALIKRLEVEDKEEAERLEKLQIDPVLMYTVGVALAKRCSLDLVTSKDSRLSWPNEAWFHLNLLVSYE